MDKRPLYIKRTPDGFAPADRNAQDIMMRYPVGATLQADIKKARNVKQHRLYWTLVNTICDNLNNVKPETLHALIKLRTGHVEVIKTEQGIVEVPGSISFHAMDQGEFAAFFNRAVDFIESDVIPGLNKDDLTRELHTMMGVTS